MIPHKHHTTPPTAPPSLVTKCIKRGVCVCVHVDIFILRQAGGAHKLCMRMQCVTKHLHAECHRVECSVCVCVHYKAKSWWRLRNELITAERMPSSPCVCVLCEASFQVRPFLCVACVRVHCLQTCGSRRRFPAEHAAYRVRRVSSGRTDREKKLRNCSSVLQQTVRAWWRKLIGTAPHFRSLTPVCNVLMSAACAHTHAFTHKPTRCTCCGGCCLHYRARHQRLHAAYTH